MVIMISLKFRTDTTLKTWTYTGCWADDNSWRQSGVAVAAVGA
jgi:anti-sigma-K factor RskA